MAGQQPRQPNPSHKKHKAVNISLNPSHMPYYVKCLDEDTWLTESRPIVTWRALETLAKQLLPANNLLNLPEKRKTYTREEAAAWLDFFFKVRDYKPSPPSVNLSAFYVAPGVLDFERLAMEIGVMPEEAAVMVKALDKPLMMAAAEEMLQAVRHSYQFKHMVELVKGRV
ncbi:MAG: hypothetical protein QW544_04335 [Candidatus Caldarchaeum sp.]